MERRNTVLQLYELTAYQDKRAGISGGVGKADPVRRRIGLAGRMEDLQGTERMFQMCRDVECGMWKSA